jgi:hypothetical protein
MLRLRLYIDIYLYIANITYRRLSIGFLLVELPHLGNSAADRRNLMANALRHGGNRTRVGVTRLMDGDLTYRRQAGESILELVLSVSG